MVAADGVLSGGTGGGRCIGPNPRMGETVATEDEAGFRGDTVAAAPRPLLAMTTPPGGCWLELLGPFKLQRLFLNNLKKKNLFFCSSV